MKHTYVIWLVGPKDGDGAEFEPLFWSNENGWGDFASATKFSQEDTGAVTLPTEGQWVRVSRRFRDAVGIQQGACNPSGIARSLVEACSECIAEGVSQREDPAVRLIVHQLAHLMDTRSIDDGLTLYRELMQTCEDRQTGYVFVPR